MEPRLSVSVEDCSAASDDGRWRVSWRLHNEGPGPLDLEAAWIPHGRFRGAGRLALDVRLEAGNSTMLESTVTANEAPHTRVDNAFLILRVVSQGRAWRIFTRMRIDFDAEAVPRPVVEVVTTQLLK